MVILRKIMEQILKIYKKYNPRSKPDGDSQMCNLWSTKYPPEVLECTEQVSDIEDIFDITLSEDDIIEIYDMNLLEASNYIKQLEL
jgi:hypothetical protein